MTDSKEDQQKNENNEDDGTEDPTQEEHDPYFEPVIMLPEVHIHSLEEDEEALVKLRAKLFRYDKSEETHQWKERGTGEIKILWHNEKHTVRVLMRRDKTWKICANHYVTPWMELKPNCDSDRAWVWSVPSDFADETPTPELFAVRFANAENANKFKDAFEEAKKIARIEMENNGLDGSGDENEGDGEDAEDGGEEASKETKNEKRCVKSEEEKEVGELLEELKLSEAEKEAVDH